MPWLLPLDIAPSPATDGGLVLPLLIVLLLAAVVVVLVLLVLRRLRR